MTQEELAAIQARYEAAETPIEWYGGLVSGLITITKNGVKFMNQAKWDIIALLCALDEAKSQNTYLGFTAIEWHEKSVVLKEGYEKALTEIMIDRYRLKTRAEALERAIKSISIDYVVEKDKDGNVWHAGIGKNNATCKTCKPTPSGCDKCVDNIDVIRFRRWDFDEARFNGEPSNDVH